MENPHKRNIQERSWVQWLFIIAAVATVIGVLITFISKMPESSTGPQGTSSSSQAPTQTSSNAPTATSILIATVAPTPTYTVSSVVKIGDGTIILNKDVTCNTCDVSFKIVLHSATISNSLSNVSLNFVFTNNTGITDEAFIAMHITDNNDNVYEGNGTWQNGSSIDGGSGNVKPGQSTTANVLFSLTPYTQTTYKLDINVCALSKSCTNYDELSFIFE